jgi:hypothetical protein
VVVLLSSSFIKNSSILIVYRLGLGSDGDGGQHSEKGNLGVLFTSSRNGFVLVDVFFPSGFLIW